MSIITPYRKISSRIEGPLPRAQRRLAALALEVASHCNTTRRLLGAPSRISELSITSIDHSDRRASSRVEKLESQPGRPVDDVAVSSDGESTALLCGVGVAVDGNDISSGRVVSDLYNIGRVELGAGGLDSDFEFISLDGGGVRDSEGALGSGAAGDGDSLSGLLGPAIGEVTGWEGRRIVGRSGETGNDTGAESLIDTSVCSDGCRGVTWCGWAGVGSAVGGERSRSGTNRPGLELTPDVALRIGTNTITEVDHLAKVVGSGDTTRDGALGKIHSVTGWT